MIRADWQHLALVALAMVGAVVLVWKPEAAPYVGPLVSALVPAALAKGSPFDVPPSSGAGS
jgi:hypothetical protein